MFVGDYDNEKHRAIALIGVVLFVLKTNGNIDWSWVLVLAPLWLPVVADCVLWVIPMHVLRLYNFIKQQRREAKDG